LVALAGSTTTLKLHLDGHLATSFAGIRSLTVTYGILRVVYSTWHEVTWRKVVSRVFVEHVAGTIWIRKSFAIYLHVVSCKLTPVAWQPPSIVRLVVCNPRQNAAQVILPLRIPLATL